MKLPRTIAPFPVAKIPFSDEEYATVLQIAQDHSSDAWSETYAALSDAEKDLIKDFKLALKEYLYVSGQGRYCCFCAMELQRHKMTNDLEHILNKDKKKNLVFDLRNLALACKDCNIPKGKKKVTNDQIDESQYDQVFGNSSDYRIVHPHLDLWSKYLYLDSFDRVCSRDGDPDSKGSQTIEICAIYRKNAMRLADHFLWFSEDVKRYNDWIEFYSFVHSQICDGERLKELCDFASSLAEVLRTADDRQQDAIEFVLDEIIQLAGLQDDKEYQLQPGESVEYD